MALAIKGRKNKVALNSNSIKLRKEANYHAQFTK